jgi:hypothetical protein
MSKTVELAKKGALIWGGISAGLSFLAGAAAVFLVGGATFPVLLTAALLAGALFGIKGLIGGGILGALVGGAIGFFQDREDKKNLPQQPTQGQKLGRSQDKAEGRVAALEQENGTYHRDTLAARGTQPSVVGTSNRY